MTIADLDAEPVHLGDSLAIRAATAGSMPKTCSP